MTPRGAGLRYVALAGGAGLALAAAAASFRHYPGSGAAFWMFHLASLALVASACRPPARYGVIALAGFLVLGHWVKLTAHLLYGAPFIEPIGAFDGRGPAWDRALWLISASFAGAALACALDAARGRNPSRTVIVPHLYLRHRAFWWTVTTVVGLTLTAWNLVAAFAMIGVDLRQPLPLRLHMGIAYWLLFGSGIWIAVLLSWERASRGPLHERWMAVPFAEALIASTSTISRAMFLFRLAPWVLVALTRDTILRRQTIARAATGAVMFAGGLAASLVAASAARALVHPPPKVVASMAPRTAMAAQMDQIPRLFVARWVGLEGVLAYSSLPESQRPSFRAVVTEHQSRGRDGIYQRAAHSRYGPVAGFTFLTLAGVAGIASATGSAWTAAAFMFAAVALLLLLERFAIRMTGAPIVAAAVGVAAANVVAQMTFPYNTAVILLESAVFLAVLGASVRVLPGTAYLVRDDSSTSQPSS